MDRQAAAELANGVVNLLTDGQVNAVFDRHGCAPGASAEARRSVLVNELCEYLAHGDTSTVFCWWLPPR